MRRFAAALLSLAIPVMLAASAHGQTYPTRVIRLVCPYPPGGPADVMGRLIAQILTTSLGQQVIVENRPGAGSTLAGREVARAEPDGYTLLVASAATLAIGPALYKNVGYDPLTSFTPVASFSSMPYVMITGPKSPLRAVGDVIAQAKARPGKLNLGVPNGAPPHMISVWFRDVTATDIVIVPYKGATTVVTDLISGHIDLGFEATAISLAHLHDGSLRPLGVATAQRLPELPKVPTMIESGVPNFVVASWIGVVAPAGTPAAIVARLNVEINAGLKSPQMLARLKALAAEPRSGTPQEFAAFIATEQPKWTAMARLSNFRPE